MTKRLMNPLVLVLAGLAFSLMACTLSSSSGSKTVGSAQNASPIAAAATWTPFPTMTPFMTNTPANTATPQPTSTPTRTNSGSSGSPYTQPVVYYTVSLPAPYPACSVVPSGGYEVNIRQAPSTGSAIVGRLGAASWINVAQAVNGWYQVSYPGTPVHGGWISGSVVALTQPCTCGPSCIVPQPPPAQCTAVLLQSTTLYSGPGTSFPTMGQVTGGGTYAVLARSSAFWYKIAVPGYPLPGLTTVGWVPQTLVSLAASCHVLPVEDPPPPQQETCMLTTLQSSYLYTGPGTGYEQVTNIAAGQKMPVAARSSGGWYKVYLQTFAPSEGVWIDGSVVTLSGNCQALPVEDPPPPQAQCTATVIQAANLYEGPSPEYALLRQAAAGEVLPVDARSSDFWYRVNPEHHTTPPDFWINGAYVTLSASCHALSVIDPPPPPQDACTATALQEAQVYSGPSADSDPLATIPAGSQFKALQRSVNEWYRLDHPVSPQGAWVDGALIQVEGVCASLPQ